MNTSFLINPCYGDARKLSKGEPAVADRPSPRRASRQQPTLRASITCSLPAVVVFQKWIVPSRYGTAHASTQATASYTSWHTNVTDFHFLPLIRPDGVTSLDPSLPLPLPLLSVMNFVVDDLHERTDLGMYLCWSWSCTLHLLTRGMPGESCRRWFGCLLLCYCDVFRAVD